MEWLFSMFTFTATRIASFPHLTVIAFLILNSAKGGSNLGDLFTDTSYGDMYAVLRSGSVVQQDLSTEVEAGAAA